MLRRRLDAILRLNPLDPAGNRPAFPYSIFVANPNRNAVGLLELHDPARLQIVIAAARTSKDRLQCSRGECVHVWVLKTQISGIAGRSELYADPMARVFSSAG